MTRTNGSSPQGAERRIFARYPMPLSSLVEARWNNALLPLMPDPQNENISAMGLRMALRRGPAPPVGAKLDIRFPLVERPAHPGRTYAYCQGRVVRHDGPNLVAVYLQDVSFASEEAVGAASGDRVLIRS